jgi:hypothetical protein
MNGIYINPNSRAYFHTLYTNNKLQHFPSALLLQRRTDTINSKLKKYR